MRVQLLVERLESGSLYEDLVVKLIFGDQKQMDRAIKRFRKKFGVNLDSTSGVIRTIILAATLLGASYAVSSHLGQKVAEKLEIHNNTIIQTGAQELKMEPTELLGRVNEAIHNKNRLASDAVAIFKPAKRDPKAEITFDNDAQLVVPSAFIGMVPDEFVADKTEETKIIENAEIHVRALDLDSSEHGWAAVVPMITDRRLPLELGPAIKPEDLFGNKTVKGTIEVISRRDAFDRMQLRSYRLIGYQ